jgi:hypothetical protein
MMWAWRLYESILIDMQNEYRRGIDSTIMVFKPSSKGIVLDGRELKVAVEEIVTESGLVVERKAVRKLNEHEATDLYHTVLTRPSSFRGWQRPLIDHLCSDDVEAWYIAGPDANLKSDSIKKDIRRRLGIKDPVPLKNRLDVWKEQMRQRIGLRSRVNVVTNILHVTDPGHEFESGLRVFFS